MMASKGVASVPTVVPYDYIFDAAGGYYGTTSRRFGFSKAANVEMIRRLKRAGVVIGVGTDLVVDWFRFMPDPYITELGHLVEAGFTPARSTGGGNEDEREPARPLGPAWHPGAGEARRTCSWCEAPRTRTCVTSRTWTWW